jgi:hypothetical protein
VCSISPERRQQEGPDVSETDGCGRAAIGGPAEFPGLQLVVEGDRSGLDRARRALTGKAELPDADAAWIFTDTLRHWPDVAHDTAWQRGLSTMIEKARPHRWIDDNRNPIKAQVEWVVTGSG